MRKHVTLAYIHALSNVVVKVNLIQEAQLCTMMEYIIEVHGSCKGTTIETPSAYANLQFIKTDIQKS